MSSTSCFVFSPFASSATVSRTSFKAMFQIALATRFMGLPWASAVGAKKRSVMSATAVVLVGLMIRLAFDTGGLAAPL